jgi:phage terminase large subunit
MIIDLSNPDLFNPIYLPLLRDRNRYLLLYGGRDSAKSYFAAQKVIIDTMSKAYSRYILVRKIYADIKDSQYQTIKDIIQDYGLTDHFHFTTNPLKIVFKPNGNMILARGLDKEYKTKSIKDPTGVWYEEMNEITFDDFLKTTTSLRGGIIQEIATFNPERETDWINSYFFPPKQSYEKEDGNFHFVKSIRNDTTILHTTYRDNQYCTRQSVELLESFKETDLNYYKIYSLGLWGGELKGLIYEDWKIVDEIPKDAQLLGYGLDFGFTNAPSVLVKVCVRGKELYLDEIFYEKKLTNDLIANRIKNAGVGNEEVIADGAEPKSIEEIYQLGINIHPDANRGKISVVDGISKMKEYHIHVTSSSRNLISELKHYKWKVDKNGQVLNEPVKLFDHGLDAARYVVVNKLFAVRRRRKKFKIRIVRI